MLDRLRASVDVCAGTRSGVLVWREDEARGRGTTRSGYAYTGFAAIQHECNGAGERIDISMLECLTEWVSPPLYVWKGTGSPGARRRATT